MNEKLKIVKYEYDPREDRRIYIEWKGSGWAVMKDGFCLNTDNEWEYEPMPSSRDEEFYKRCRYISVEEAFAHVEKYYG